jgi:hypothetical protein
MFEQTVPIGRRNRQSISGTFAAMTILATLMGISHNAALAQTCGNVGQNCVPNGNFSLLTGGGSTPGRDIPPLDWTSTNTLDTVSPSNSYLGTNSNIPVGGSGLSARLESHAGQGLSNAFAGTIVSNQFTLPALASGQVYQGSFSLYSQTTSVVGANPLTGSLTVEVLNPNTNVADIIQNFTFNGGTQTWQTFSAVLPDFQSGGPAVFEFLFPAGTPLMDGHLFVADVSVQAVAAPGPIPGAGLLSYIALGLIGLGSYGWKRLRPAA